MSAGGSPGPSTRGARRWFIAYACLLFTLTHWPRLELPTDAIPRPDLFAHLAAFALWTFLCLRSAWFGPRASARNFVLGALACLAYAALDELTQAIPIFQRDCAWDDFAADLLGVGLGLAAFALLTAIDDDPPHARR